MVDGRRKGNGFEVEVAYAIADWLCPVSGGWKAKDALPPFRRRPADKDNMPTDWLGGRDLIHRPEVYFPFSVECKKYADWSIDTLFMKPTKVQLGWWTQCVQQADDIQLCPLLILGRNGMEPVCVLRADHWETLLGTAKWSRCAYTTLVHSNVVIVPFIDFRSVPPLWLPRMIGYTSESPHAGGRASAVARTGLRSRLLQG